MDGGQEYECGAVAGLGLFDEAPLYAPLLSMTPTIGITGTIIYYGDEFPELEGKILYCSWNGGGISVGSINSEQTAIEDIQEIDLRNSECRIDLTIAPDGKIIYSSAGKIFEIHANPLVIMDMAAFEVGGQTHSIDTKNLETFEQARMNWVKLQHQWQPGASGYDVLGRVNEAQDAGLKVLLNVVGPPNPTEIDFDDFIGFVTEAAQSMPDAIEIWNGMNLSLNWPAGQIAASNYVDNMLLPSYEAIKKINPRIIVMSGGLSPTGGFGGCVDAGCDDDVYINEMVSAGAENYIDCVGVTFNAGATAPLATSGHPFDGGDGHYSWYYASTAALYSSVFSRPLCFTGLGYVSSEGYDALPPSFAWGADNSEDDQAQWLSEAIVLAKQADNVRMVIVYNVDFDYYGSDDPQAGYAILRPDGTCPACSLIAAAIDE